MEIEEYFKSERYDLFHILNIIRECSLSDDEIAEQLIALYRAGKIVFAYQGNYPIDGGVNAWTEDEWQEGQKKGTFFNQILRGNYRRGIKKSELESVRRIMRKIKSEVPSIRLNWGYVRYKK